MTTTEKRSERMRRELRPQFDRLVSGPVDPNEAESLEIVRGLIAIHRRHDGIYELNASAIERLHGLIWTTAQVKMGMGMLERGRKQ